MAFESDCDLVGKNGDGSVEIFTVTKDGTKVPLNGTSVGALKTYRARTYTPVATVGITAAGGNVTITYSAGSILQSATSLAGPWTDVAGAANPYTAPANAPAGFYRARR